MQDVAHITLQDGVEVTVIAHPPEADDIDSIGEVTLVLPGSGAHMFFPDDATGIALALIRATQIADPKSMLQYG